MRVFAEWRPVREVWSLLFVRFSGMAASPPCTPPIGRGGAGMARVSAARRKSPWPGVRTRISPGKRRCPAKGIRHPSCGASAFSSPRPPRRGKQRWVLCLDAADGHLLWQKSFAVTEVAPTYPKTGYAAPTPVTDGQRVYAFFDAPGLVALDMDGNVLWTRALGPFKAVYNMGNSPVLCEGKVIICCDHSGDSFIAAFDQVTGEQCWRTPRKQDIQFSTPLIITVAGKKQIVVNAKTVVAYDPATGKELWSCRGMMDTVVPSAVFATDWSMPPPGATGRRWPSIRAGAAMSRKRTCACRSPRAGRM